MAVTQTPLVTRMQGRTEVDRESGCLVIYERFSVQRPGHEAHVVEVEVSGDNGTPQAERCDCRGYHYRGECSHITAVYEAGMLGCEW